MDVKLEEHLILACNAWILSYNESINVPKSSLVDIKLEEHLILACSAWLLSYNEVINLP